MSNLLEPLGIDAETERVYRALLAHPREQVGELARSLALTEDRVGAAVDQLGRMALVRASSELPGGQRPVRAEVGMELLLTRQEAQLQEHAHRLSQSRAAAAQFVAEAARLGPQGAEVGVEVLVGIDQIRDRLATLGKDVHEELLTFAPDGAQTDENMRASRPLNAAMLERGVRLRTLYLTSIRGDQPTLAHAQGLVDAGAQVRTVATLPTRMIVMDRRVAVLPIDDQDSGRGAVVVTGSGLLVALCALFEAVWAEAEPLDVRAAPHRAPDQSAQELSTQELATLRLMATGLTLSGIAKRLGVSTRTARRITASLLERLEAGSRFEAGVKAVQRGWLPVDG